MCIRDSLQPVSRRCACRPCTPRARARHRQLGVQGVGDCPRWPWWRWPWRRTSSRPPRRRASCTQQPPRLSFRRNNFLPPKTPSRRCRGLSHRPVATPLLRTWPVAPRVGGQAGLGPLLRNNLPINLGWARPVAPHNRIPDPPERLLTATTPDRTPIEPAPFYLLVRHYN